MNTMINNAHTIHMIGIKGVGMTALAQVLLARGKVVTGSDTDETFFTDNILRDLRIKVTHPFASQNLPRSCDLVIRSGAYDDQHPEVKAARERNIPVLLYAEALGELSAKHFSIGIAGTHGKTTTTAMLGLVTEAHDLDPTVIVGTQVPQFGNHNARVGNSDLFIAETCEYRRSFLHFTPRAEIITNIDQDHLDYFHDLDDLTDAFQEYLDRLPDHSIAVLGIDSAPLYQLAIKNQKRLRIVTFGLHPDATFRPQYGELHHRDTRHEYAEEVVQSFNVLSSDGTLGPFTLKLPGHHNVLNATAVIALSQALPSPYHIPISILKKSLSAFCGTTRRLERKGELKGITIYDDYAHHPTEIKASLQGLRSLYPAQKITAVFMSHTYSRTKALLQEFGKSFKDADTVIVNDIYASAREDKDPAISGEALTHEIGRYHPYTTYIPDFGDVAAYLITSSKPGDVIVTMGAGDNWKIGELVLQHFRNKKV